MSIAARVQLDRNLEREIADFVIAEVTGEATTEEIIPGLVLAIKLYAQEFKGMADPDDIIRAAAEMLEEDL